MKTKGRRPLWKRVLIWSGVGMAGLIAGVILIVTLGPSDEYWAKVEAKRSAAEAADRAETLAAEAAVKEALIKAAKSGSPFDVWDALDAGADLNLRDEAGNTFLHLVAGNRRCRSDTGAPCGFWGLFDEIDDPNALNDAGQTALHVAAEADHPGVVGNLLSDALVDPCIRDAAGKRPYDIAKHMPTFQVEGLNRFALGRLKFAECD